MTWRVYSEDDLRLALRAYRRGEASSALPSLQLARADVVRAYKRWFDRRRLGGLNRAGIEAALDDLIDEGESVQRTHERIVEWVTSTQERA